MLKNELVLKDKTISEFDKEKSQLLELITQLKDEKQNGIVKDFTRTLSAVNIIMCMQKLENNKDLPNNYRKLVSLMHKFL